MHSSTTAVPSPFATRVHRHTHAFITPTMQRLIARASSRGGLGASQASAPKQSIAAAWRSLSRVHNNNDNNTRSVSGGGGSEAASRRSVYTWSVPIPLTKIVATIGPVSEQFEPLQKVGVGGCNLGSVLLSMGSWQSCWAVVNVPAAVLEYSV